MLRSDNVMEQNAGVGVFRNLALAGAWYPRAGCGAGSHRLRRRPFLMRIVCQSTDDNKVRLVERGLLPSLLVLLANGNESLQFTIVVILKNLVLRSRTAAA